MPSMPDRRTEARSMCADMFEIYWDEAPGRALHATALLEDISPSGACLQLERPVPLGALIRWECANQKFEARVRYCSYRDIGYFVGIEFGREAKWSKQSYRPQHLLELEGLIENANK